MKLYHVLGNTWYFKDWQCIPFYKLDDTRVIFLDAGMADQIEALDAALMEHGLVPVGILGSHTHIDHSGANAFFQKKYGTKLALSLGEAALLASPLAFSYQYYDFTIPEIEADPILSAPLCVADRIILPHETELEFFGVKFGIVRTPGHTLDHICIRTPDDVLYLGDAMMTGRTLYHSKFPYAFNVGMYIDSMIKLREEKAALYLVAHDGVYEEILPMIDLEIRFLQNRMLEILELITETVNTPKALSGAICRAYRIKVRDHRDASYFERASMAYLTYLRDRGYVELYLADNQSFYRRTPASYAPARKRERSELPPTGRFQSMNATGFEPHSICKTSS